MILIFIAPCSDSWWLLLQSEMNQRETGQVTASAASPESPASSNRQFPAGRAGDESMALVSSLGVNVAVSVTPRGIIHGREHEKALQSRHLLHKPL